MNRNNQFILKWTSIVAALTVLAKFMGFFREAAIAFVFGASMESDAYFMALTIPSLLFIAFNDSIRNVFIPIYGSMKDKKDGQVFVTTFTFIMALSLMVFMTGVILLAPLLVRLIAPGFEGEAAALTASLLRITAPALFFMGMVGLFTGYLHSHHSFLGPALISLPHNLIIIVSALTLGSLFGIKGLAIGTVVAYSSQFLIQLPWLRKSRFTLRTGINFQHHGLHELYTLIPPVLLASASSELKAITDRIFASYLQEGVIASLRYASRIRGLSVSIFAIAIITVLYPTLVDKGRKAGLVEFKENLRQGMGFIIFVLFPITAALAVLSTPVVQAVFMRGAFDETALLLTASILFIFSFALAGEGIMVLLTRAFFAIKDTKTPMFVSLAVTALNAALNYIFIGPFQHRGIAMATTLSFWASVSLLFVLMRRKIGPFGGKKILQGAAKTAVAALGMAGILLLGRQAWAMLLLPPGFIFLALELAFLGVLGTSVYLALASVLRIQEMHFFMALIRKKLRKKEGT